MGIYALALEVPFVLIPSQHRSKIDRFPLQYTKSARFLSPFVLVNVTAGLMRFLDCSKLHRQFRDQTCYKSHNSLKQCLMTQL